MDSFKRLLIWCSIFLSQTACDFQGHLSVSNNIKESRRRNVFITEYEVIPNPCIINDSIKIKVLNAWLEKQWGYGKFDAETIIIKNKYQLVIKVEPDILKSYGVTWRIGISENRYIRNCGSDCLVANFNELPGETEDWKVQNGRDLDSFSKKKIIGNFRITKK